MTEPDQGELERFVAAWASRHLGFDNRALRLERMVEAARAEWKRLGSLQALERALDAGNVDAEAALVAATTVGETYFFRQNEHFDLLAKLPLPADGRIKAWSAGCATGEEAYSLAATLRKCYGLDAQRLEIWGTDVNAKAIAAAREAVYGRWSWRQNSARSLEERESLALERETRDCVRFARHNLLHAAAFDHAAGERFDLVFCRNVLVYFSPEAAASALKGMRAVMKPGAWLVLGNMDLGGPPEGFTRVGSPALCVYAKDLEVRPSAPAIAAATAPAPAAPAALSPPVPRPKAEIDPVDWHKAVLAELEAGNPARAQQELRSLVENFPQYLPGLFEYALALRRAGQEAQAAAALRGLLNRAQGRDSNEILDGPEPISLEYYVTSAKSFIESAGGPR